MLGLAGLAAALLWWRWVGYQGHDDAYYAWAAVDWAEHGPALGRTHWALRYPLVLPTAALIRLFGFSVPVLAAVDLAAYAAFLAMGYAAARRWFGGPAAAALTAIGILVPQFPVQATYANPDLLEMALVMGSFWLVMLAREPGQPGAQAARRMLGAGALAGLGFLTRETTLLLVPLYGLMVLLRPAMPRWRYLLIAAGFVAVVGAQMSYFAIEAGDPLYRLRISASHDHVDRAAQAARATGALDGEGVLAAGLLATPLAALFVSQKYGLLFYLAVPAYAVARRARRLDPQARSVLDWAAAGAAVSFLFVALNAGILYVVPRYFMVTAAMAAVPVAAAGAELARTRPRTAGLLGAGFAASCLGLLYLENTEPMFAEQRAAAFIAGAPGTVYMDAETTWRTSALLIQPRLLDRLASDPPPPGALVAGEAGAVEACLRAPACPQRAAALAFRPGPGWTEVARYDPPRRRLGIWLREVGAARLMPADILRKIEQPGRALVVYRTPVS
jgi:4-amino-4-deoxy-L-arabinose transferase-like glycosyltransferase